MTEQIGDRYLYAGVTCCWAAVVAWCYFMCYPPIPPPLLWYSVAITTLFSVSIVSAGILLIFHWHSINEKWAYERATNQTDLED